MNNHVVELVWVNSIFLSIDGEVNTYHQGRFSTFVRMAGCNLRCKYCDTKHAQDMSKGTKTTVSEIYKKIEEFDCNKVTITGGEPLLQIPQLQHLIHLLHRKGYTITVETSGSLMLPVELIGQCYWVVDFKLPSSGHYENNWLPIYNMLSRLDWVKFVICTHKDYEIAREMVKTFKAKGYRFEMAFSPGHGVLEPAQLIDWMKQDKFFDPTINLQLHRIIWPDAEGEV